MQKMLEDLYFNGFDWGDPPRSSEYHKARKNLEHAHQELLRAIGEENPPPAQPVPQRQGRRCFL